MTEIKDYFLIGDLQSAALVSNKGSIDWLCLPYFDSPALFSKILDKNGGAFSLIAEDFTIESSYLESTAVMVMECKNKDSSFAIFDFMVPQPEDAIEDHFLVREIECYKGNLELKFLYNPRPEYGKIKPLIELKDSSLFFSTGDDSVILYLPAEADTIQKEEGWEIIVSLKENDKKSFILEYLVKGEAPAYTGEELKTLTIDYWHKWVSKGTFFDYCKSSLIRSAITLKLMQFAPTGALIAAPTTSLPEEIGGVRNWDYRYVWIRDATFILYAFYVLNYTEEAVKFFNFIETISEDVSDDKWDMNLAYTIHGKSIPLETYLPHLEGYKNSKPVRIGNDAAKQFQLDVYGALIDAHYFVSKRGIKIDEASRNLILKLAYKIRDRWKEKDNGIWEVRKDVYHFTYSKVMAWVGINRTLRLADKLCISEDEREDLRILEKEISDWIWNNCYDKGNLYQHSDSTYLDATNFLFVLLQFLDKGSPDTKLIIENTCSKLCHDEIFVYRYFAPDGLPGGEGAFLLCTFWYISALAIMEESHAAEQILDKFTKRFLTGTGLLSEEIEPSTDEFTGNYPQAFSHLGLILSAHYVHKYKSRKENS